MRFLQLIILIFSLHLEALCASTGAPSKVQQQQKQGHDETLLCTLTGFDPAAAEYRWLNDVIPYSIDENISDDTKRNVVSAMWRWERDSCFMFVPRNTEVQFISFETHATDRCCIQHMASSQSRRISVNVNSCSHVMINTLIGTILAMNTSERAADGHITLESSKKSSSVCEEKCGGIITANGTGDRGNIQSPNHPSHYPSHLDCMWKISAPAGYGLRVSFQVLDVEPSSNCIYDYLEITHLNSEGGVVRRRKLCSSPVLSALNSDTIERNVDLETMAVLIHFHSDDTYTGRGFMLEYQLLDESRDPCSNDNGGCSQVCTSHVNGRHNCSCREGYTISTDGKSCTDLNECSRRRGGCQHKCRNTDGSFYCICRSGHRLNSDMATCSVCAVHANSSSREIFSRHFPAPYQHMENCVWTITPWAGHRLQITINFLDILPSRKCKEDYLKFKLAHFPNQGRLCGHHHDITYLVDEATSLRFRSKNTNSEHSGFRLTYKHIPITAGGLTPLYVRVGGNYIPYRRRHWIQAG